MSARVTLILLSVVLGVGVLVTVRSRIDVKPSTVVIHGVDFNVEIADTTAEQQLGLSGRSALCERCGMLFTYPVAQVRPFWMKDMLFPLDFVWIRRGRVVDLTVNIPPPIKSGDSMVVTPREPVDMVLELSSGAVSRYRLTIGDRAEFKK